MSSIQFLLVLAVVSALIFARSIQKSPEDSAAITLVFIAATCYLAPVYLMYLGNIYKHVDIAAASIGVTSVMVAVTAAFIIQLAGRAHFPGRWLLAPAIIWLAVGAWVFWDSSAERDAGLAHLGVGFLAWLVGSSCAYLIRADVDVRDRAARYLTALIAVQAVVVVAQILGFNVNPMSAEEFAILGGRYNGLLNHPGQLSNATLIVFALILTLRGDNDSRRSGRVTTVSVLVIGICIAAGSRAQIVGAFVLLTVWAFLASGRRRGALNERFGAFWAAILGLLVSYPVLRRRFEEDPNGGARGILQDIGLRAVMDHPLSGVGPNSYVSVIGLSDTLTASGVPVHNAFLLSAVELGIVGAAALWFPIFWTFWRSFRLRRDIDLNNKPAASIAFFLPFLLSIFTGWGLLADPLWPLLMVAMGTMYGFLTPTNDNGLVGVRIGENRRKL